MDRITNDRNVTTPYGSPAARPDKPSTLQFGALLASSVAKTTPVLTPAGVSPASSTANLKDDLNAALRAYGISVPPSLRMTETAHGLELSGDNRNSQFQAMLNARPDLRDGLNSVVGTATASRKTALNQAMLAFGGEYPDASMSDFLKRYKDADKSTELSVKFDGAKATVEERNGKGSWGPVKDKDSFMTELLAAYTKYLVTHGVSNESDKDDPFADFQLKQKLAEVPSAN